jgi:hypothetical protein
MNAMGLPKNHLARVYLAQARVFKRRGCLFYLTLLDWAKRARVRRASPDDVRWINQTEARRLLNLARDRVRKKRVQPGESGRLF